MKNVCNLTATGGDTLLLGDAAPQLLKDLDVPPFGGWNIFPFPTH
jgi:hypothetical protein